MVAVSFMGAADERVVLESLFLVSLFGGQVRAQDRVVLAKWKRVPSSLHFW